MNHLKTFASTAAVMVSLLALGAASASATVLTDGSGNQHKAGTAITAVSEGALEIHTPSGSMNCANSHFGGKTTTDGGVGTDVKAVVETFSLTNCNAKYVTIGKGALSIAETGGGDANLFSTGLELTREYLGFHCIFRTSNTNLGTLTGGSPATLDVEATIPRIGGKSGAFCGTTDKWTGSYAFSAPSTLNID